MTAVLLRARADFRARWRAWVTLVVVTALSGGAVIALVAGARRTESAFPRFLSTTNAADLFIYSTRSQLDLDSLRATPGVADVATVTAAQSSDPVVTPAVLTDPRFGSEVNGFEILDGRRPDPHAPHEILISFALAHQLHLHAGGHLSLNMPNPVTFDVVGVAAAAGEFPPRSQTSSLSSWLTPAFLDTPEGRAAVAPDPFQAVAVRLRPGVSVDDAITAIRQRSPDFVSISTNVDQANEMQRSARALATVLRVAAAIAAVALLLVLAQLLVRDAAEGALDDEVLRAVGFSRAQRRDALLLRYAGAAVVGAVGAFVVAVALSPAFPLGLIGTVDPDGGITLDAESFLIGIAAIIGVVSVLGANAAWRSTRGNATDATHVDTALTAIQRMSLPPVVDMGARFALDPGRGRRALPVRATLSTATVAIGAIVAALTVSASLQHLLATPALYGVTYDAHVEMQDNDDIATTIDGIRADPDVEGATYGTTGIPLQSGNVSFGGEALVASDPRLDPTMADGRLPVAADEIALGSHTIEDVHAQMGDTIPVAVAGITSPLPFRVVGRAVIAPLTDNEQLGRGAVISPAGLDRFVAAAPPGFQPPPDGDAFVSFRPGVDTDAALTALRQRLVGPADLTVTPAENPNDIATFSEVRNLPAAVGLLLAVVAALTVGHLLVSSVRRRRHDLAVLKAIGYTPRQVAGTIAWQASVVAVIALVIGMPLGVAAGRSVWMALSTWAGVVGRPALPMRWLLALVPATLVFANLVAVGPAAVAARTRAADFLRSD